MASSSGTGRGLSSLYADLLDPPENKDLPKPGTISRAPVVFNQSSTSSTATSDNSDPTASAKKQAPSAAALRFQPLTKRPQPIVKKPTLAGFAKVTKAEPAASTTNNNSASATAADSTTTPSKSTQSQQQNDSQATATSTATPARAAPVVKSTLEDWANNEDYYNDYHANNNAHQRGGKKRKRKNKEKFEHVAQHWDDIYDPSRPNSYEEYRDSEEKDMEMRDWRDKLYAKRRANYSSSSSSDGDDRSPPPYRSKFAPPSNYSFAPPPSSNDADDGAAPPPPPPPADIPDDATGDDAYARRMRMSGMAVNFAPPKSLDPQPMEGTPSPPPTDGDSRHASTENERTTDNGTTTSKAPNFTISKAPVRYDPPPVSAEDEADNGRKANDETSENGDTSKNNNDEREAGGDGEEEEEEEEEEKPRSSRPGQAGFAERLMSKYGWTKGTGLGADRSGIVQPLHVKVNKGKNQAGTGKIIDRNKKRNDDNTTDDSGFGKMSEVIVLRGMVNGLEDEDDGVLLQEIGEECGEKYGRVERVVIRHRQDEEDTSKVFVQFTDQVSALRAVNALEGRIFNGNTIKAQYYDSYKFEQRDLDG